MIKRRYSALSLMLILAMIIGAFASCNGTTEKSTENQTIDSTESVHMTETETDVESHNGSNSTETEETESETTSNEESDTVAPIESETESTVELEGENGALISLSNKLANAPDTYYANKLQDSVIIKNGNMILNYNMSDVTKGKLVSSLSDTRGNAYLKDTMDVFVKMKDGSTFYAGKSLHDATLNIYRYGYYYYENRLEGQSFISSVEKLADTRVNHMTYGKYNGLKGTPTKSKGVITYVIEGGDPWISYNTGFSAERFDYLEITLSVKNASGSAKLYLTAGSHTYFTEGQSISFALIDDGEFHTYRLPLSSIDDYKGTVTGIRLDIDGPSGTEISISEISAFKAGYMGAPADLTVQRSFINYSDKLHHILQLAASAPTKDISEVGMITKLDADTVEKLVVKDKSGLKYSLDGIDWESAEYVGFDIKGVGIFGYILPYDGESGSIRVELSDKVYSIIQSKAPRSGAIFPSEKGTKNANDFYMGQRIYTDSHHSFDAFINEAECERHPLGKNNISIDAEASDSATYAGYDALRGYYKFTVGGTDFNQAYYNSPNKHYRVKFTVKGDTLDREMYFMTYTHSGNLECAVLLDGNDMLLPIPLEVAKNFNGDGENTIYNLDDAAYGEVFFPMVVSADESKTYSILNLYQNWGIFPLKQISSIQFSIPYYHLSTGVTETNCIVPLPTNGPGLPDHRAMSAPFWKAQPQHNSGGSHNFLRYTDANGIGSGSNNIGADIDSYGPTYCDLTLYQIGGDGKVSASYTHTEMPQTDENRAYYEMKYTFNEDISFKDFYKSFTFYSVTDNNPKGTYKKVGYLNEDNECCVTAANTDASEPKRYVLGDECPYFSFFDMPDYDPNYTAAEGYTNLSFLIYDAEFVIGGEKAEPSFMLVNSYNYLSLTLDLKDVEFKAGDSIVINAIIMPWGSQESDYSGDEPDFNVREVRRNTLLNPAKATAGKDCEVIDSVFVPKLRSTNGKNAEFTLSGGHNNVALRVYGFDMLTAPYIEEYVDGQWREYKVSSINKPDAYKLGHYYDGYMVHYDGDGTYSYSFVVEMDNGKPRQFRISADKAFTEWPEESTSVEKTPDPINVYLDPNELLIKTIGFTMISRAQLADDASYVRFYGKSGIPEAYMNVFSVSNADFADVTSTGQYFVFKYRMPKGKSSLSSFEFFTSTINGSAVTGDNMVLQKVEQDDEWHVVIIDITKKLSAFKPNDKNEYLAKYFRFDFFNGAVSNDMYIDIAYMGLSDSLEDILKINADSETVMLVNGNENIIIDTKTGEEYVAPAKSYIDASSGYTKSDVVYYGTIDMINGMGGNATHFTGVVGRTGKDLIELKHSGTTISGSKLVFTGWAIANGGIEKYVWSADGGKTWHDAVSYNGGSAGNAQQAHLDILKNLLGGVEPASGSNIGVHFQSGVGAGANVSGYAADLSEYVGQKVNVTFAAVPKAEPDSLCLILHVTDVTVVTE